MGDDGLSQAHAALSIAGYIYRGSTKAVGDFSLTRRPAVMGEDPFILQFALP